jgi:membrane protein DedA with SNARE-associated domain
VKQLVTILQAWGPFGVVVLAALDSAGLPLPTIVDIMIVTTAISSPATAFPVAALTVASSCAGCMFMFSIARKGGSRYLDKHASSPRAMKFRHWYSQYGLLTVFIPALVIIPLPVKVFVFSAGALGARPLAFLAVVLAARIPRYFGLAWLGMQLGADAEPWLASHAWHVSALSLALFLSAFYLVARLPASRLPR